MSPTIDIPWSNDAEQSVLGALLLDSSCFDRVGDMLSRADFFDTRHAAIYDAISALSMANKPADVLTVFDRLGKQAEEVGGLDYINRLSQSVYSANNVRRHAEIIRERAIQRKLMATIDEAATIARGVGTIGEKVEKIASLVAGLERGSAQKLPKRLDQLLVEGIDRYTAAADGTAERAWSTPIPILNSMLNGGFRPGRVYILAARPSVGKSSFAEALGVHFAGNDLPTLILSQEMPDLEVADRAVSMLGRVDYADLQTGDLKGDGWDRVSEAVERGSRLPFYVDDQPALTVADIRTKARSVRGLKVLIVDYLQLCASSGKDGNRNAEVEEISRALKGLAKEMGIAVLNLSQLNRKVEERANKEPVMSDLRDSGSIEQDADVVMFLWPVREFQNEGRRIIGCKVDKNRQGSRGKFGLDFFGAIQRWGQSTADIEPEKPAAQPKSKGFE